MIDTQLVIAILKEIGDGQYIGTPSHEVIERVIGDFDDASENEQEKLVYHMDELHDAGLFRAKGINPENGWGFNRSLGGDYINTNPHLVLTPFGGEALEELGKPKGIERFKAAIRASGTLVGAEAVKYAVGELFKSAMS